MIVELKLIFKDAYGAPDDDPAEIVYTLSSPEGFEVTGGQIFVENPDTANLDRFTFRIDRDEVTEGAKLTILENPQG